MGVRRMRPPSPAQSHRIGFDAGFMSSSAESCFAMTATTPIVTSASTQPKKSRCSKAMAGTATLSG